MVEQLIDKTFNDMIFVEGGSFMMGDPVEPFVAIINDAVKNGDKYSKYMSSDRNRLLTSAATQQEPVSRLKPVDFT